MEVDDKSFPLGRGLVDNWPKAVLGLLLAFSVWVATVAITLDWPTLPALSLRAVAWMGSVAAIGFWLWRKQAGAVKAFEAQLQQVFEGSAFGALVISAKDQRILNINQVMVNWIGWPKEAQLGQAVTTLLQPVEGEQILDLTKATAEFAPLGTFRLTGSARPATYVRAFVRKGLMPVPTASGSEECLLIWCVDVSSTFTAYSQVDALQNDLQNTYEQLADGFISLDRDWRVNYMNKAFERMSRTPAASAIGKKVWEGFPVFKEEHYKTRFQKVMDGQDVLVIEGDSPLIRQFVRMSAFPLREGMGVYFADLSAERRTKESLQKAEWQLQTFLNQTEDIIWFLDDKLRLLFYNEEYAKRRAVHSDQPIRKDISIIEDTSIPDRARGLLFDFYQRALAGERVVQMTPMSPVVGLPGIYEIYGSPVRDAEGKVIGIGCISRDITRRVHAERRILQQQEHLRHIAWLQSHQVRGPVASILGLTQIFDRTNPGSASNLEIVTHMETMAQQLDQVIRSIVDEATQEVVMEEGAKELLVTIGRTEAKA